MLLIGSVSFLSSDKFSNWRVLVYGIGKDLRNLRNLRGSGKKDPRMSLEETSLTRQTFTVIKICLDWKKFFKKFAAA